MTSHAPARVLPAHAEVRLAVAARRVIHGQRDHRTTGSLHASQDRFARFPRIRRVELIPRRPAQRFVYILNGRRCHRREYLHRAVRFGRSRRRQFALGKTLLRRQPGTEKLDC